MKKVLLFGLLCMMQSLMCIVVNDLKNLRGKLEQLKVSLPQALTGGGSKPLGLSEELKKSFADLKNNTSAFKVPVVFANSGLKNEFDKVVNAIVLLVSEIEVLMPNEDNFIKFLGAHENKQLPGRPKEFEDLLGSVFGKGAISKLANAINSIDSYYTSNKSLISPDDKQKDDKQKIYEYLKKIDRFLEELYQCVYKFQEQNKIAMQKVSWEDQMPPAAKGMAPAWHWFEQMLLIPLNREILSDKVLTGNKCASGALRCDILAKALRTFAPGTGDTGGGIGSALLKEAEELQKKAVIINNDDLKKAFDDMIIVFNPMLKSIEQFEKDCALFGQYIKNVVVETKIAAVPASLKSLSESSLISDANLTLLFSALNNLRKEVIDMRSKGIAGDKAVGEYLTSMSQFLEKLYYTANKFYDDNRTNMDKISWEDGPTARVFFIDAILKPIDRLARPYRLQDGSTPACLNRDINCAVLHDAIDYLK